MIKTTKFYRDIAFLVENIIEEYRYEISYLPSEKEEELKEKYIKLHKEHGVGVDENAFEVMLESINSYLHTICDEED